MKTPLVDELINNPIADATDDADESTVGGNQQVRTHKEVEVYCTCRKAYQGEMMISCDECGEWYHPACVNIHTEDEETLAKMPFQCSNCYKPPAKIANNSYKKNSMLGKRKAGSSSE